MLSTSEVKDLGETKFPDGRYMISMLFVEERDIFPDAWGAFSRDIYVEKRLASSLDVTLKIFTTVGPKEYPFTLKFKIA